MTSFRSILESSSTIDRLWSSVEATYLPREYYLDYNTVLVLADAYEDLATEDSDSISKGLRYIVDNKRCPVRRGHPDLMYYAWMSSEKDFHTTYEQSPRSWIIPYVFFYPLRLLAHIYLPEDNSSLAVAGFKSLKEAILELATSYSRNS